MWMRQSTYATGTYDHVRVCMPQMNTPDCISMRVSTTRGHEFACVCQFMVLHLCHLCMHSWWHTHLHLHVDVCTHMDPDCCLHVGYDCGYASGRVKTSYQICTYKHASHMHPSACLHQAISLYHCITLAGAQSRGRRISLAEHKKSRVTCLCMLT